MIDITRSIRPGMPVWPGDPEVETRPVCVLEDGDTCNVTAYSFGTHTGTHVDAPRHYFEDGGTADEIPLDALIGPCWLGDFTSSVSFIGPAELEKANIPIGTERLLLKTNGSRRDGETEPFQPDFVSLSLEGAEWVIRRGIRLIGIDTLSIEQADMGEGPVHRSLLSAPVVIIEGLDLAVAPGAYRLICLPLKLMHGDGAPARVILEPMTAT